MRQLRTGESGVKEMFTLNIYGEQLNQVLIELTDCIGISAEERQMPINGLDRPKLGVRNEPPLSLAISRREKHIRRHRHDKGLGCDSTQRSPRRISLYTEGRVRFCLAHEQDLSPLEDR